jgi:hypothetical protein
MARPRKEINFAELKKLCGMQCTAEEIAGFFGVSTDTIDRRLKEKYNYGFAEYFKKNNSLGKVSLRRSQFALAEKSATMAIWLGKQYLGQSDEANKGQDLMSLSDIAAAIRSGDAE